MRIQEAAALVGVEPHVLRHWEDEGVIRPERSANGYRVYDEEVVARLRVIIGCRDAGLSLSQIRLVLHGSEPGRAAVIAEQRARVHRQLQEMRRTVRFLDHVISCRHSLMSRCPRCSPYAESVPRPTGRAR